MSEWVATHRDATAAATTVVLAGMLVVLLIAVVRRSRRQHTDDTLTGVEELPVSSAAQVRGLATSPVDVPVVDETENHRERVLRLLVASLETALEGQDERVAEAAGEGKRAVLLTIASLRETLAEQSGEIALNRIEAALGRLGTAPVFDRPTLTTGPSGAHPVRLGVPQALVAPAVTDPGATGHASDSVPTTVTDASMAEGLVADVPAEPPATPAQPVAAPAPVAPVQPVVKPVPAPASPSGAPPSPSASPHRRRRVSTRGRRLTIPRSS